MLLALHAQTICGMVCALHQHACLHSNKLNSSTTLTLLHLDTSHFDRVVHKLLSKSDIWVLAYVDTSGGRGEIKERGAAAAEGILGSLILAVDDDGNR